MNRERPDRQTLHHARDDELLARAIPIDKTDGQGASVSPNDSNNGEPLEAIELDETQLSEAEPNRVPHQETEAERARRHKIQSFGDRAHHEKPWRRQPHQTGQGAVHVRTFIAKLRIEAMEHLDEQINDWLEAHPEYEIKFVTTTMGPLKGKLTEEALFVNVWV